MVKNRKIFISQMKAKVTIEAIKGIRTIGELSKNFGIHPTQIAKWKKYGLEHFADIFENPRGPKSDGDTELVNELYRQIGKLQVELDWLKKKFDSKQLKF